MSTKYITDEDHQRQMLIEDLEAELSHWRLRSRSGERRFAERYHKVPLTSTGLVVERQRHPKERWPNCRKEYHNQLGSQIEDHPKSVKATASYPARDRKSKGRARKLENSSDEEDDSVTPSDSVSNYTSPNNSISHRYSRRTGLLDGHPALQESPMKSEQTTSSNYRTKSSGWITLPRSCILHGPDAPYECERCGCQ